MLTDGQPIIHFRHTAFNAKIDGNGDQEFHLTPVVIETYAMCGIGLMHNGSIKTEYGLFQPRDLITSWRALKFLNAVNWQEMSLNWREMSRLSFKRKRKWLIDAETLPLFYNGAMRHPPKEDRERYKSIMVRMVGKRKYEEIFSLPIPEIIVNTILEGQRRTPEICLFPLRQEIMAGTIRKQPRFRDYDIR